MSSSKSSEKSKTGSSEAGKSVKTTFKESDENQLCEEEVGKMINAGQRRANLVYLTVNREKSR